MSYCFNPTCQQPQNQENTHICFNCGSNLLLSERYRALKIIGQGGFGKTYLAQGAVNNSLCVIKQFSLPSSSSTALRLFSDEAGQLKSLGIHEQIPTFIDYVEQQDECFIVQEFINGSNLEEELAANGAFSEAQVEELLLDILPVIDFIHDRSVIHRDIKPENIICRKSDSRFVLVDFGAAKQATTIALAKTGTTIGSAGYTAPEQVFGKAVKQSDLYSLGVTCVHLLTNMHPFDLVDSADGNWVWRDYLKQPVSTRLGQVIDKLLERGTRQRYQSAAEVWQDLYAKVPVKVAESTIQKFPRLKIAIVSLLIVGGLGTIPLITNISNHPQVATIPQEQVRKSPVRKPVTVPQQPQAVQSKNDLMLTIVDVSWGMDCLIILLGLLSSVRATTTNEDIRPGLSLLFIGLIFASLINVSSSVFALEPISTSNNSVDYFKSNSAQ